MRWSKTAALLLIRSGSYIHGFMGKWGQSVKKILTCAWSAYTLEVDTRFLLNRSLISYNRKGVTAFAVFLLPLFRERWKLFLSGAGCRSTPSPSGFLTFKNLNLLNS